MLRTVFNGLSLLWPCDPCWPLLTPVDPYPHLPFMSLPSSPRNPLRSFLWPDCPNQSPPTPSETSQ